MDRHIPRRYEVRGQPVHGTSRYALRDARRAARLKIAAFVVGVLIVVRALSSAIRVFVLPRASNELIARLVFTWMRRLFEMVIKGKPYAFRDRVLAYFAPSRCWSCPSYGWSSS